MTIAKSFVNARKQARALAAYPGPTPQSMAEAYRIQDEAIALYGDRVAGWKVGLVPPQYRAAMGAERLLGPIFACNISEADGIAQMPVFTGGFGAVEAEFVIEVGADADPAKLDYTLEDAAALVGRLRIGIEPAGSPFPGINDYGPAVTASDFGNNAGLILGAEIADWRTRDLAILGVTTWVDGNEVGRGTWDSVQGTPIAAFAFALGLLAQRGRPLKRTDLITTGAVTGIHEVVPGQTGRVVFDGIGEIYYRAVPASD